MGSRRTVVGDACRRVCCCDASWDPEREMGFERRQEMIDGTWPLGALSGGRDVDKPLAVRVEKVKQSVRVKETVIDCGSMMAFSRTLAVPAIDC